MVEGERSDKQETDLSGSAKARERCDEERECEDAQVEQSKPIDKFRDDDLGGRRKGCRIN
jgi:hypothetical protein